MSTLTQHHRRLWPTALLLLLTIVTEANTSTLHFHKGSSASYLISVSNTTSPWHQFEVIDTVIISDVLAQQVIDTVIIADVVAQQSLHMLNMVELAQSNSNVEFSTLAELVVAADLVDTLSGTGPFTLFAPTNEAFAKLPANVVAYLTADENKNVLAEVLMYHVVAGEVMLTDLVAGEVMLTDLVAGEVRTAKGGTYKTMNSGSVTTSSDNYVTIDDANVTDADVEASNVLIHIIDSVLIPAAVAPKLTQLLNLFELAQSIEDFSMFVHFVEAGGLVDTLSGPGPFVLFAPTNAAIANHPRDTVNWLLADENKGALEQVVKYHVDAGKALSTSLVAGAVETVQGQNVTVSLENGVMIDDATVKGAYLEASNGIIYIIDTVLIPEGVLPPEGTEGEVTDAVEGDMMKTATEDTIAIIDHHEDSAMEDDEYTIMDHEQEDSLLMIPYSSIMPPSNMTELTENNTQQSPHNYQHQQIIQKNSTHQPSSSPTIPSTKKLKKTVSTLVSSIILMTNCTLLTDIGHYIFEDVTELQIRRSILRNDLYFHPSSPIDQLRLQVYVDSQDVYARGDSIEGIDPALFIKEQNESTVKISFTVFISFRSRFDDINVTNTIAEAFDTEEERELYISRLRKTDDTSFQLVTQVNISDFAVSAPSLHISDVGLVNQSTTKIEDVLEPDTPNKHIASLWNIVGAIAGASAFISSAVTIFLLKTSKGEKPETVKEEIVKDDHKTAEETIPDSHSIPEIFIQNDKQDESTLGEPYGMEFGRFGGMDIDENTASVNHNYDYLNYARKHYDIDVATVDLSVNDSCRSNYTGSILPQPSNFTSESSLGTMTKNQMSSPSSFYVEDDDQSFEQHYAT